jgi:hypothetical protein
VNDALELTAAKDQQPVETLAAHAFNPALGVRTRSRRPHRLWGVKTRFASRETADLQTERRF